jgi:glycosyltransferase involved in cell wall biosynthesis
MAGPVNSRSARRRLRVLCCLHVLSRTGAPKMALDAIEAMGAEIEPFIVAIEGGALDARCRALGRFRQLTSLETMATRWSRLRQSGRWQLWAREVAAWQPDVIYLNSVEALRIVDRMRLPDVPVLLHVHELESYLEWWARHRPGLLRDWPARFVAASEAGRRALHESANVSDERITVMHSFVPDDYVARLGQAGPPNGSGTLVIGGAGQTVWRKGTQLWLEMARVLVARLGSSRVRFRWLGVGDGPDDWQFRRMAHHFGLEPFLDLVPITGDPLAIIQSWDLLALTSWEDAFPLVVLESMLARRPVACFAGGGGAPEAVDGTGLIVDDFSAETMAGAIAELTAVPERLAGLGQAAHARVAERFTASAQVPTLLAELHRVAAGGSA